MSKYRVGVKRMDTYIDYVDVDADNAQAAEDQVQAGVQESWDTVFPDRGEGTYQECEAEVCSVEALVPCELCGTAVPAEELTTHLDVSLCRSCRAEMISCGRCNRQIRRDALYRYKGRSMCWDCAHTLAKSKSRPCAECGRWVPAATGMAHQELCQECCSRKHGLCANCGVVVPVSDLDGHRCHGGPLKSCANCGEPTVPAKASDIDSLCELCGRLYRLCAECGEFLDPDDGHSRLSRLCVDCEKGVRNA